MRSSEPSGIASARKKLSSARNHSDSRESEDQCALNASNPQSVFAQQQSQDRYPAQWTSPPNRTERASSNRNDQFRDDNPVAGSGREAVTPPQKTKRLDPDRSLPWP